jgi:predicted phosphodiesterase
VDETGLLAWLHAGDLINGADEDSLHGVRPWLLGRKVPLLMVRGNHDFAPDGPAFYAMDLSGRVVTLAEGLYPERFRVQSFPSPQQLEQMGLEQEA